MVYGLMGFGCEDLIGLGSFVKRIGKVKKHLLAKPSKKTFRHWERIAERSFGGCYFIVYDRGFPKYRMYRVWGYGQTPKMVLVII